jgi:hypothetical protein
MIDDPDHSEDEERFILLGLSANLRLLVVSHTYSEADLTIRIISARKAKSSDPTRSNIGKGGNHEEGVWFFKRQEESLCESSEETGHYKAR